MTTRRYEDLSRTARRRLIARSLLRSAASVTLMVTVYYLAPLDRPLDTWTGIRFVIDLLVVAGIITWQVRAVVDSEFPRLRAIEAVAIGLPLLLLVYASTYVVVSGNQAGSFTENLGHTGALYFTITVFSTVGFGDIAPTSEVARIITMTQMLVGLAAVGLVARILLGAVQMAVERRTEVTPDPPPAPAPRGSSSGGRIP
ncbi:MAG TPA: potassium channel family protein [Pseudonocardiaceae bacterium]